MSEFDFKCPECDAPALDIDMKCRRCGASLATTAARQMLGSVVMGEYEIEDVIGQGGMAIVYAGRHRLTGQEVALKVLPPELARDRHIRSRFLEEARALARLDHPNIVHLYNFGEEKGCFVLAMQLARGDTWERLIFAGELDWKRSVKIAIDVTRALEYAHERGIVHRDMKPSNVLIRAEDGAATVMDFGIAKAQRSAKLTDTGQTMGTVRYMSPEQVRGKQVDARSDIYSLGIALYESLSGETPFDGETAFDIMNAHLKSVAPPLGEAVEVPEALRDLVRWMLSKNPDDRPASAAAVRAALEEILEGERPAIPAARVAAAETAIDEPRRFPVTTAAATLLVLGAAVAAFFWLDPAGGGSGEPSKPADTSSAGAAPAAAPADARSVKQTTVPDGFEVAVEQSYPEDHLRVLAAPGVSSDGLRSEYQAGVERWKHHLAGLADADALAGDMPDVTILIGPADLLCDRAGFASDDAWRECLKFGTFREDELTVRIPAATPYRELAIHSAVPLAFCAVHPSERCSGEAQGYLARIFSQ